MTERLRPTTAAVRGACAVAAVMALLALLTTGGLDASSRQWLGDLAALVAAAWATLAGALRARRSHAMLRASWVAMTTALACATAGEAVWAWTELIGQDPVTPLGPSDVCYLLFYPLTLAALLMRPGRVAGTGTRSLLEGLIVAASCLAVSAVTVLSPVLRSDESDGASLVSAFSYPVGDLLLVTVLLLVTLRQPLRSGPVTLAAGLLVMGVADTAFAAMSLHGVSWGGATWFAPVTDVAYVAGYLLVAEGALRDRRDGAPRDRRYALLERLAREHRLASNLPLVPAACAFAVGVWLMLTGSRDIVAGLAVALVMVLLIARQVVVQRQNKQLLTEVLDQQATLLQQANHDPLTGLGNRRLFTDRLAHALALHRRHRTPLAVLLIDVDDFKQVNDTYGHGTGDEMLLALSGWLELSTRRSDTVARLGGDEFAVLMEGDADPLTWATRFLLDVAEPVRCTAGAVDISVSVGIARLGAGDRPAGFDELLLRADTALYRAKQSGKGQAVEIAAPTPSVRDLVPVQEPAPEAARLPS